MSKYIWITIAALSIYVIVDYRREILSSKNGDKQLTFWCRIGSCYIIPGKYYWPWLPKNNYIRTKLYRNGIGIVWMTGDDQDIKISFSNEYSIFELDSRIAIYESNEILMKEYGILDSVNSFNRRNHYNDSAQYYIDECNYVYIGAD